MSLLHSLFGYLVTVAVFITAVFLTVTVLNVVRLAALDAAGIIKQHLTGETGDG